MKDKDHWLASPKREEFFGPLGVTNIRTFVDPQNPTHVAVVMDIADLDVVMAAMQTEARSRGDGARRRAARDAGAARRGVGPPQAIEIARLPCTCVAASSSRAAGASLEG